MNLSYIPLTINSMKILILTYVRKTDEESKCFNLNLSQKRLTSLS